MKKLSYVLRHNPASIGITLDENGYAFVDELIIGFNEQGSNLDKSTLIKIVNSDTKERYSFNSDKTKIRANYGHTFSVDLGQKPLSPPDVLYHGTADKNIDSILECGIRKEKRNYVHLTTDTAMALAVGERYGNAVIFKVNALQMSNDGFVFYKSGKVWLTDYVPKGYLSLIRH